MYVGMCIEKNKNIFCNILLQKNDCYERCCHALKKYLKKLVHFVTNIVTFKVLYEYQFTSNL